MIIPFQKFETRSLRGYPWGNDICRILSAAIHSVDAGQCIRNKVSLDGDNLIICDLIFNLEEFQRIVVLGAGKAVVPMVEAMETILGDRITAGIVITKDGYEGSNNVLLHKRTKVIQAGHPVPDERNLSASSRLVGFGQDFSPDDLVICLISGGGSALLLQPSAGLSLMDIQATTSLLLECGASIDEINTIRKHIDDIKGGGLAKKLFPASVITLILSDIVGDNLDMVASGPTVADTTTYADAWAILNKFQIVDQIPSPIRTHLINGIKGIIPETIKPGNSILGKVKNIIVGNNTQAAVAAVDAARNLGFSSQLLPNTLNGEASQAGFSIVERVKSLLYSRGSNEHPTCFVAGGETTVTVTGTGKGGRNQELALGAVKSLSGNHRLLLISLATDGGDGPTDAAGAVATNQTLKLGLENGLDPAEYLYNNDSYNYFEPLGDLVKIGPTLTNVNDLLFIFSG